MFESLHAVMKQKIHHKGVFFRLVGEGGFEPPKSLTADLQSVPFGHSGIPPYSLCCTHFETQRSGFKMKRRKAIADMELFASAESGMEQASFDGGAGRRIRTPDLLITNQLLYRLSYTSNSNSKVDYRRRAPKSQELFEKIQKKRNNKAEKLKQF